MRTLLLIFTTAIITFFIFSCGSNKLMETQQGADINYKPGFPEFYINAFGFISDEQAPTIEVATNIIKGSLTYTQNNDSLSANVNIDIQVVDLQDGENIIQSKRLSKTIQTADKNVSSSTETVRIKYSQEVPPSAYKIIVVVEDEKSGNKLSQTAETYIPKKEEKGYTLSAIQMHGKDKGDKTWEPIAGYNVEGKTDSLRFIFQVISPKSSTPLTLNGRLVKFDSDTSYPRSMSQPNYSSSSIEYKGIDFDDETEIQSNRRVLSDYSSTFVEYKFENKERGNYRFEVTTKRENDEEEQFKARAFGIKSANYPAVKSTRELAKPLVYLMNDDEYEEMMAISDKDSLKQAIDRFWLKNIGNKQTARRVIQLFYTRVEEANKQFSNFKEGWKTDRGMIYILFGNPFYTRDRLKRVTWYYSYNNSDPEYQFRFEQPKIKNQYYPFDHFILERKNYYHNRYYYQKQMWLSGQILTRRI